MAGSSSPALVTKADVNDGEGENDVLSGLVLCLGSLR